MCKKVHMAGAERVLPAGTLHGCILFAVGWPAWQVNRGFCLGASVGTSFTMPRYCAVMAVFTALTEIIHSCRLCN